MALLSLLPVLLFLFVELHLYEAVTACVRCKYMPVQFDFRVCTIVMPSCSFSIDIAFGSSIVFFSANRVLFCCFDCMLTMLGASTLVEMS